MKTQDEKHVSTDGKTTPETPENAAKTDGNGFALPLNHDAILTALAEERQELIGERDYLEMENDRLYLVIASLEQSLFRLIQKSAQLDAANELLSRTRYACIVQTEE
jgi:hypothetical protein